MIFEVIASTRNLAGPDLEAEVEIEESCDPTEVSEQVLRLSKRGYWVGVFSQRSGALLAGPFSPNAALPACIL